MPYETRLQNTHIILNELNIDAVIATSPANFFYFSGIWLDSHERLQAIIISKDTKEAHMIVPKMSVKEVASAEHFTKHYWRDGENALEVVEKLLPDRGIISIDNFWPSSQLLGLMEIKEDLKYIPSTYVLARLRLYKDNYEIELLRKSSRIADEVVKDIMDFIKPGMTETEVVDEVIRLFAEKGVNELSFNPIIGSGSNGAIPHHTPDETLIKDGDMVVLDLGGIKDHYCSDITRTFVVGEPTDEMEKVHKIVQKAQNAAFQVVKPGVSLKEIDETARKVITDAGYGEYFTHRTGHGIGIQVHEEPYVTPVNEEKLAEGMVITIEPGIYLEGKFGVRIEDIVVITANGGNRLNSVNSDLVKVKTNIKLN